MERFFWICLAGAARSGARYLMALWSAQRLGSAFPHGTLIVNLGGCFIIAASMHTALTLGGSPHNARGCDDWFHRRAYYLFEFQLRDDAAL
jgi:fluoride ion exporter CrcB/FEX